MTHKRIMQHRFGMIIHAYTLLCLPSHRKGASETLADKAIHGSAIRSSFHRRHQNPHHPSQVLVRRRPEFLNDGINTLDQVICTELLWQVRFQDSEFLLLLLRNIFTAILTRQGNRFTPLLGPQAHDFQGLDIIQRSALIDLPIFERRREETERCQAHLIAAFHGLREIRSKLLAQRHRTHLAFRPQAISGPWPPSFWRQWLYACVLHWVSRSIPACEFLRALQLFHTAS